MTRERVAGSAQLGALRALVAEWQREGRELHEQAAASVLYADELEARADALEECAAGLELAAGLLEQPKAPSDPRQLTIAELAECHPLESGRELARELLRFDRMKEELAQEDARAPRPHPSPCVNPGQAHTWGFPDGISGRCIVCGATMPEGPEFLHRCRCGSHATGFDGLGRPSCAPCVSRELVQRESGR